MATTCKTQKFIETTLVGTAKLATIYSVLECKSNDVMLMYYPLIFAHAVGGADVNIINTQRFVTCEGIS